MDGRTWATIGRGFVVLLGIRRGDTEFEARHLAQKTANLRVFPDSEGKMNQSILDVGGEVLVVPQFTLYADTQKGNRPSFIEAAPPEVAEPLYVTYVATLQRILDASRVATGVFRAYMIVDICNDGPVTVMLEDESPQGRSLP